MEDKDQDQDQDFALLNLSSNLPTSVAPRSYVAPLLNPTSSVAPLPNPNSSIAPSVDLVMALNGRMVDKVYSRKHNSIPEPTLIQELDPSLGNKVTTPIALL